MSAKAVPGVNGGAASEPLIAGQGQLPTYEEKEPEGAVYKSTIDQVEIKQSQTFVGLSKEELEQYAHDPFWRRLRYFFVILFWLAWIGMFFAAIILVLLSPKCPPKPYRHWWEKKICYEIWTKSFKDSDGDGVGDLRGLTDQLSLLEATVKASAIWPTPLLKSSDNDGVGILDHKMIDPVQGDMHDFDRLIRQTHKNNMHLVMDIPLTVVSVGHEWFNKSSKNEDDFTDFFIWRGLNDDRVKTNQDYSLQPGRGYYRNFLQKSEFAILNWEHEPVRKAMRDVLKFWLDKRVDGFYLGEVQYLALDQDGHPQWDRVHQRLKDINKYMREDIHEKQILTFTSNGVNEPLKGNIDEFKLSARIKGDVDYVVSSELVAANEESGAPWFHEHLSRVIDFHQSQNVTWPMWEIGHPHVSRVASRLHGKNETNLKTRDQSNLALMLLMVLPGSINVYYGDEIGMLDSDAPGVSNVDKPRGSMQWSAEKGAGATDASNMRIGVNSDYTSVNFKAQLTSDSTLKMFKRLAALRRTEDAFLYGGMELTPKHESGLGIISSSNHSTTDFFTILNFDHASDLEVNLEPETNPFRINMTEKEAYVVTTTPNLAAKKLFKDRQLIKSTKTFFLGPYEGIVIKLKPAKK